FPVPLRGCSIMTQQLCPECLIIEEQLTTVSWVLDAPDQRILFKRAICKRVVRQRLADLGGHQPFCEGIKHASLPRKMSALRKVAAEPCRCLPIVWKFYRTNLICSNASSGGRGPASKTLSSSPASGSTLASLPKSIPLFASIERMDTCVAMPSCGEVKAP